MMLPLTIELVPQSAWFSNLRSELTAREWQMVKEKTFDLANYCCEICGGIGRRHPVECHEVWDYNPTICVQTFIRPIALCPACHEVKHYGLAEIRGRDRIARAHLMRINKWTGEQADQHIQQAFSEWSARNQISWALNALPLLNFIKVSEKTRLKILDHAQGLIDR